MSNLTLQDTYKGVVSALDIPSYEWLDAKGFKLDAYCAGVATWLAYNDLTIRALDTDTCKEFRDEWAKCLGIELDGIEQRFTNLVFSYLGLGKEIALSIRKIHGEPAAITKPRIQSLDFTEGEEADGYRCESCESIFEEDDVDDSQRLYECGECGMFVSDSNRCESCNKFASRIGDMGCHDCNEGELIPLGIRFEGGEWVAA